MKFKYYVDVAYWNSDENPPTVFNEKFRSEKAEGAERFSFEIEVPDDSIPIETPKVTKEE